MPTTVVNCWNDICFSISGNVIENVESWPHLCHVTGPEAYLEIAIGL